MDPCIEAELSLIVLEQHASWPACAREHQRVFPCSLIEVQAEGELPAEFAGRVGRRARSIVAKGNRIRVAIIATNGLLDAPTRRGRRLLAQVVAQAMGLSGERVLSTVPGAYTLGPPGAQRLRGELVAVAGLLCAQLAGTEIIVSVDVTDDTAESGLRPRVRGSRDPSKQPAARPSAATTEAAAVLDGTRRARRQS